MDKRDKIARLLMTKIDHQQGIWYYTLADKILSTLNEKQSPPDFTKEIYKGNCANRLKTRFCKLNDKFCPAEKETSCEAYRPKPKKIEKLPDFKEGDSCDINTLWFVVRGLVNKANEIIDRLNEGL